MAEDERRSALARAVLRSVASRRVLAEEWVPRAGKGYGLKSFWDERYATKSLEDYDWLCDWSAVRESVVVPKKGRILHVGCGNSVMGLEMAKDLECEVVNLDYSEEVIKSMRRKYPGDAWVVGDATKLDFPDDAFDAVVEKGTLDALACGSDKSLGVRMVDECVRVAKRGSFVSISFGQPETRLRFFEESHGVSDKTTGHITTTKKILDDPRSEKKSSPVYIYSVRGGKKRLRKKRIFFWGALVVAAFAHCCSGAYDRRESFAAAANPQRKSLEPWRGSSRCNYELLKSFSLLAEGLNWTLGAGTLLGAMRSKGLLAWEHDVDVYVEAPSAFLLLERLSKKNSSNIVVLRFRGHVDAKGEPCCGFGYKLFHATKRCEVDVLVLAAATYAPWPHAKHRLWPPWSTALAAISDRRFHHNKNSFLVIPEDVDRKQLCADARRWNATVWRGGPSVAYFHNEYFAMEEFHPIETIHIYDLTVNVPRNAWASLHRTYGPDSDRVARIDTHNGIKVHLRHPKYAHLLQPADISDPD